MTRMPVPDRVRERLDRSCEVPFTLLAAPAGSADGDVVALTSRGATRGFMRLSGWRGLCFGRIPACGG